MKEVGEKLGKILESILTFEFGLLFLNLAYLHWIFVLGLEC